MSSRFIVNGPSRLVGEVWLDGAKNSVLKLMAATLLAEGTSTITNVPDIADVHIMAELLERLGCKVNFDGPAKEVRIEVPSAPGHKADYDLVRKLRASINVLGPLVTRLGIAEVALPGGDAIGSRGLDFHIKGLTALGAKAHSEHGYVIAEAPNGPRSLVGAEISLDFPSVGATENLMTAAVLAEGVTVIDNAAREPDVVDLGNFLIEMGANIQGLGSNTITIEGVDRLQPTTHATLPDRIVAGTWAFAAAITRGDITVHGARASDLELPLDKLVEAGAAVTILPDGFRVKQSAQARAVDIVTLPYPGFPTDLQPMAITLNAVAEGSAIVTENVFEGRFMFVNELMRLGAEVSVDGHHACITGKKMLSGAPVVACDIRAGASLVLAALVSDGETIVDEGHHIERGYPDFAGKLRQLGAKVEVI